MTAKADTHSKTDSETGYGHQEARVWAAQFIRLDVKVQSEIPNGAGGQSTREWLKLRHLYDLKKDGVRDDDKSENQPEEYVDTGHFLALDSATKLDEDMVGDLSGVDWNLVDAYLDFISKALEADEDSEDEDDDEDLEEQKRSNKKDEP